MVSIDFQMGKCFMAMNDENIYLSTWQTLTPWVPYDGNYHTHLWHLGCRKTVITVRIYGP
jgi:hypothetical protein